MIHFMDISGAHERLATARKLKGYTRAIDAAAALNTPYTTYHGHETGQNGLSRAGRKYAKFFGVSYQWLMTGQGPMVPLSDAEAEKLADVWSRIPAHDKNTALKMLEGVALRPRA